MEGSKCPGYSRLAEVESGSNGACRVTMGGQGEDVFLLSRGGGAVISRSTAKSFFCLPSATLPILPIISITPFSNIL